MWTRWKLLQRRRGTRVLLYHFSLCCDCYVCFSLEPLFFECCWWTPKIVRCFLVCTRLSNILSSLLFESACSFFNCFFIASFFCFVFVFFVFFHEFFILHFIHHLIYECFYFTEICSLVVGEICCLSNWTPPGVWCGTGKNWYVMNIFKTICNAVLPLTCLAYNLVNVCDYWWYHTNVFTTLLVSAKFLTLFRNVGYYSHIARRLIAGAEWY